MWRDSASEKQGPWFAVVWGLTENTVVCLRTTMLNHTYRSHGRNKELQKRTDFLLFASKPAQRVDTKKKWVYGSLGGRTYDTLGKRSPLESGEAQVTDLNGSSGPSDKDVVTLEVTVDDWRRPCMKEVKPFQDLPTPTAQDFDLHLLEPF